VDIPEAARRISPRRMSVARPILPRRTSPLLIPEGVCRTSRVVILAAFRISRAMQHRILPGIRKVLISPPRAWRTASHHFTGPLTVLP
jgi:hypothetical protein